MAASNLYSLDNDIFRLFATHSCLLVLKMIAVGLLTSRYRFRNKIFANVEDLDLAGEESEKLKPVLNDQGLERIRRCHLNDLENIVPFVVVGLFFVATNPTFNSASLLFRVFTFARYLHTVAYLAHLPQPCRSLAFFIGVFVNLYMGATVIYHGQL